MKRRSQEEWKNLIEQQQISGQSTQEFCQEHGINDHYFSCVKSKLKKQSGPQPGFQTLGTLVSSPGIIVRRGDIAIHLPTNLDPTWLATLVKQLSV